jgi:2-polyprenyl-3-methyl-5-hydroxy-6-metoxy-1,4-benzoquinol methylase
MLAAARRQHGALTVRYLLGDAVDVPEPPDSYDAIFCSSVVPHFADVGATVQHLASLLRPGGRLLLCHDMGREQLASVHVRHGGAVGEDRLPPTDVLAEMVRAAGLTVAGVEDGADCFWLLARRP